MFRSKPAGSKEMMFCKRVSVKITFIHEPPISYTSIVSGHSQAYGLKNIEQYAEFWVRRVALRLRVGVTWPDTSLKKMLRVKQCFHYRQQNRRQKWEKLELFYQQKSMY
jgi:hypothetical protein